MKLGVVTRFRWVGPETVWLLRAWVDSVLAYAPVGSMIVVVNDHGRLPYDMCTQLARSERHGVRIVDLQPTLAPFGYLLQGSTDNDQRSIGPLGALTVGLTYLRAAGCTHALSLDSDALLLRPFPSAAIELAADTMTLAVGDLYDRVPNLRVGCPHSSCVVLSLDAGVPIPGDDGPGDDGPDAAWYAWHTAARVRGWRTVQFPFYRGGYAFHLGWGTLLKTLDRPRHDPDGVDRRDYGSVPGSAYLERDAGCAWGGWLRTRGTGEEFLRDLGARVVAACDTDLVLFTPEDFACPDP